ncbi:hypothetical protein CO045_02895 [Candidatus Peregrinibacteria bacterium CG_4_9_14_0_2_um_filter_41_14]|nr:MAG: hypothetical protein CO045_02895 [Candidatus Peregrinibacteria bacterium CG_4_9_14_0_2_um_filter_41_14]
MGDEMLGEGVISCEKPDVPDDFPDLQEELAGFQHELHDAFIDNAYPFKHKDSYELVREGCFLPYYKKDFDNNNDDIDRVETSFYIIAKDQLDKFLENGDFETAQLAIGNFEKTYNMSAGFSDLALVYLLGLSLLTENNEMFVKWGTTCQSLGLLDLLATENFDVPGYLAQVDPKMRSKDYFLQRLQKFESNEKEKTVDPFDLVALEKHTASLYVKRSHDLSTSEPVIITKGALGTAFYIGNGYWLTNKHVVAPRENNDAKSVLMHFPGLDYPCGVSDVIEHPLLDLAVIKSNYRPSDSAFKFDESISSTGYKYVFGYAGDPGKGRVDARIVAGKVSANVAGKQKDKFGTFYGYAKGGMSGGPVFNEEGKIIGILKAGYPNTAVSKFIPVSEFADLLESLPGVDFR